MNGWDSIFRGVAPVFSGMVCLRAISLRFGTFSELWAQECNDIKKQCGNGVSNDRFSLKWQVELPECVVNVTKASQRLSEVVPSEVR